MPDKYWASTEQVSEQESVVLQTATSPVSRAVLQQAVGLGHREHFVNTVLKPLLEPGLLEMTIPDKPRSSKQRYRLTSKGQQVLSNGWPRKL